MATGGNEIALQLTTASRDWQKRQSFQNEAIKPFSSLDYMGLQDFSQQMSRYSSTSLILTAAWRVISEVAGLNGIVRSVLQNGPGGMVSKQVLQTPLFNQVLLHPEDLLGSPATARQIMASSVQALQT